MIVYHVSVPSDELNCLLSVCKDWHLPVIPTTTLNKLFIITAEDFPFSAMRDRFKAEFTKVNSQDVWSSFTEVNDALDQLPELDKKLEASKKEVLHLEDANGGLWRALDRANDDAREHEADEKAMLSAVEYHKRESEDRLEDLLRMTEERDKRNADALAYLEERDAIESKYDALLIKQLIKHMQLEQEIKELKVNAGAQLVVEPAYVIFDVEGVVRTHHKFKSKEAFYEFILRRSYAWRDNGLFTRGPNIEARLVQPSPAEIGKFVPVED